MFYSLMIQNVVRESLLSLVDNDHIALLPSITTYLHLAVRLFMASAGDYDPLVRYQTDNTEPIGRALRLDDSELAKLSVFVRQDQWSSVGITTSGEFLQYLFEDGGLPIERRAETPRSPPHPLSNDLSNSQQNNIESNNNFHCAELSAAPNLYSSLHDEQVPPPPEDMNPIDPDLTPQANDLRSEADLYTPPWVRGHGDTRESWCGLCKPGRWMKSSNFWYDKSFTHGIIAATGSPFQEPHKMRRMAANLDVWEGLCGNCNEWVALVSSKKKGSTWFRHAYKVSTLSHRYPC